MALLTTPAFSSSAAPSSDADWNRLLGRLPQRVGGPAEPGLMAGSDAFTAAKQRIGVEPMSEWWADENNVFVKPALSQDLASRACREPDRARFARACAFAWRLTGEQACLDKAREGLRTMGRGGWSPFSKPWIDESEAAVHYLQTLDLLREGSALDDATRQSALETLLHVGSDLYKQSSTLLPRNNWRFHAAWAVAMLGLGLGRFGADTVLMADWTRRGLEEMSRLTSGECLVEAPPSRVGMNPLRRWVGASPAAVDGQAQISPDGVFGEGPTYSRWQWIQTVELAMALRRTVKLDLFEVKRLRSWGRWHVLGMLPNGEMPPLGDAYGYSHIDTQIAANSGICPDAALFRWHWDYGHDYSRRPAALELGILTYDSSLAPRPPESKSAFYLDGGLAVLRSGWGRDEAAAVLQGSSPLWVGRDPAGHRHPDATSFLVWAAGEPLVIEGGSPVGYDDPEYEAYYNTPRAHSLILIDGQGPFQGVVQLDQATKAATPGVLRTSYDLPGVAHASMEADYASCRIRRGLWLVEDAFVLVADTVRRATSLPQLATMELTPQDKPFGATWLIHSPVPRAKADGKTFGWARGQAALEGAFLEDVALSQTKAKWADDKKAAEGALLAAERRGTEVEFTALMAVGPASEDPRATPGERGRRPIAARRGSQKALAGRGSSGPLDWLGKKIEIEADVWVVWSGGGAERDRSGLAAAGLVAVRAAGEPWLQADGPMDFAATHSPEGWRGVWGASRPVRARLGGEFADLAKAREPRRSDSSRSGGVEVVVKQPLLESGN